MFGPVARAEYRRTIGDTDSLHGGWSFAGKAAKRNVVEFLDSTGLTVRPDALRRNPGTG
jgi:hypothetical protein